MGQAIPIRYVARPAYNSAPVIPDACSSATVTILVETCRKSEIFRKLANEQGVRVVVIEESPL